MSAQATKPMVKKGRPLHIAVRTASGQKSRAKDTAHVPLNLVREQVACGALAAKWLNYFGRMALERRITEAQHNAGERFAALAESYRAAIEAPPLTPQAQDVNRQGGHPPEQSLAQIAACRRVVREYQAILYGLRQLEIDALEHYCIKGGTHESYTKEIALKQALDKLVLFWAERTR